MTATISKNTIKELRMVTNKALADTLIKLGLSATLGRITYVPDKEFRCKLTVSVPRTRTTPAGAIPVKGEHWSYCNKTYLITDVDRVKNIALGKRRSRSRSAIAGVATYRVRLDDLIKNGEKVQ